MRILVTGGAGFIGSALVRHLVLERGDDVCTLDKLTYSGSLDNLGGAVLESPRHRFERIDLADAAAVSACVDDFAPEAIFHLAAESHVDRSIDGPAPFIASNIVGTYHLLEAARALWQRQREFRFVHVSTDEVYGSLGADGLFTEDSPYRPSSPYSASKASSDHLARAWFATYGLPVVITNCSNNYGPRQYPEKLIPLTIHHVLSGRPVPVYGDGRQVRDWLYVEDHVSGLVRALEAGQPGRCYNLGGNCEKTNLEVVEAVLAALAPHLGESVETLRRLITHVADRPGHDRRYALDTSRVTAELGWRAETGFEEGMARTVAWYLARQQDGRAEAGRA